MAMLLMFLSWRDVFLDKEWFFGAESGASRSDLSSMVEDLPWCPTAENNSFYSEKSRSKDLPSSTRTCEPGYVPFCTYLVRPVCNIVINRRCAKFNGNTAQCCYLQAIESLVCHPLIGDFNVDVCFAFPNDGDFDVRSHGGKLCLIQNLMSFRKDVWDVSGSVTQFWPIEIPCKLE
jgi:hypothetical protein